MFFLRRLGPIRGALLLLVCVTTLCGTARADQASDTALFAKNAHETYCAGTGGSDRKVGAKAINAVSAVLMNVTAVLEAQGGPGYLHYWHGLLEQCLSQDEAAADALSTFLKIEGGNMTFASMIRDAERRLRWLGIHVSGGKAAARPRPGAVGLGVGLAAGAGVLSGLSAWQWSVALSVGEDIEVGGKDRALIDADLQEGSDAALANKIFLGGAIGLGAASLLSFVLMATSPKRSSRSVSWQVLGGPGDLGLGVQARW